MSDDAVQQEANQPTAVGSKPAGAAANAITGEVKPKPVDLSSAVSIDNKFDIYPGARLQEYDVGPVKAYQASETGNIGKRYIALISEPHLVPRIRASSVYLSFANPSLATLVDIKTAYWPPARQERCIFIYKDGMGRKILADEKKGALGWKQEQVMKVVVDPMVSVLKDLRDKDFVHDGIRASNMYDGGGGSKIERVVLGDCLSMPASFAQPALYQTIERSMANPLGRGPGSRADDMYAFGVALSVILRSNDPCAGMTDDEIIRSKIEYGSYSTVTGKDRFKGSILELLRGLLHDDPEQRWTLEDVQVWLDGRRLSPKQSLPKKKASRAITFNGNKYFQLPLLAMDIAKNPPELERLVENRDLEQWIKRSLEDDEALERYEEAEKTSHDNRRNPGYEDKLVSLMSMALDPEAPARFKDVCVRGDGIGYMLVESIVLKKDLKALADILMHGLLLKWVTSSPQASTDTGSLISRFDSCRNYIRQTRVGFGLERCVYLLCPEAQCLSEKLRDYFVRSSDDMLLAFENLCSKGHAPSMFLDRHSIAFLSVKDAKIIDPFLHDLDSPEEYKKIMANLKCLAAIQKRANISGLPHIAAAFSNMLGVVYDRFHDREIRDRVKKSVEGYIKNGDLVRMAGLLDNTEVAGRDMSMFRQAMQEYRALSEEASRLESSLVNKNVFGRSAGKEVAALVSTVIAGFIIMITVFLFLTKKSFF